MSSVFRQFLLSGRILHGPVRRLHYHFNTLSSNQTGHLAFNQKIRRQIPAGWPFYAQAALAGGTVRERRQCGSKSRLEHHPFLDRKLCSEAVGF